MKRLLLALAGVTLASCNLAYSALTPFPCPADNQCPDGLSCVPGVGCQAATADSYCFTKATDASADHALADTDCSPAGEGASCYEGRCEIPCRPGNTCGEKRVCSLGSSPNVKATGVCLIGCVDNGSCPNGMNCVALWHDGQKGCVDEKATPPTACASFESQLACGEKFNCGVDFFAECPSGTATSACPTSATCTSTGCQCPTGYSLSNCNGDSCGDTCTELVPNFGCKPDAPVISCTASPAAASGICQCTDGRQLTVACGSTTPCEKLCEM